jgi:hypothetical protein
MQGLSPGDLIKLVKAVFPRRPGDRNLALLVDAPRSAGSDSPAWRIRRGLAGEWARALEAGKAGLEMESIRLLAYPDVGSNNADLPETVYAGNPPVPATAGELADWGEERPLQDVFRDTQIILAPTQYSTTAPLKVAARAFGFRAATMPGFSPDMIPALRIDYNEVFRRVLLIKGLLDRAVTARVDFHIDDRDRPDMVFDLRHRRAHASTGRFPDPGTAGNLPSGEAYIVPYEGEAGEPSRTRGTLPVQVGEEILLFEIEENRARRVSGDGEAAAGERARLAREPAYGNMAELGFGVLADFGIRPIGQILLDEKLGFHVAFGRSEHFGGQVGPRDFSRPEAVVHLDRIYIPAVQPRIHVASIRLEFPDGDILEVMAEGRYLVFG